MEARVARYSASVIFSGQSVTSCAVRKVTVAPPWSRAMAVSSLLRGMRNPSAMAWSPSWGSKPAMQMEGVGAR